MAAMLCQPPPETWHRLGEFDWTGLVHAEPDIVKNRPLPVAGAGRVTTEIIEMLDKRSAALVSSRTVLRDGATDAPITTGLSTTFIRGAGGFGGDRGTARPLPVRITSCASAVASTKRCPTESTPTATRCTPTQTPHGGRASTDPSRSDCARWASPLERWSNPVPAQSRRTRNARCPVPHAVLSR